MLFKCSIIIHAIEEVASIPLPFLTFSHAQIFYTKKERESLGPME